MGTQLPHDRTYCGKTQGNTEGAAEGRLFYSLHQEDLSCRTAISLRPAWEEGGWGERVGLTSLCEIATEHERQQLKINVERTKQEAGADYFANGIHTLISKYMFS